MLVLCHSLVRGIEIGANYMRTGQRIQKPADLPRTNSRTQPRIHLIGNRNCQLPHIRKTYHLLPWGLLLTGQLGNVMQESAKTGQSYAWSHAEDFGIDQSRFRRCGVHHVPASGIPKDGPSAGVTMVTALTSVYTGLPVRTDTAMTGEVTLSGLVLPIGGIKEKVLAARRLGIKRIILPKANEKNLRDIPEPVRAEMEFIFAERVSEVLHAAIPGIGTRLRLAA